MVCTKNLLLSQTTCVTDYTVLATKLSMLPRSATIDTYSIAVERIFRAQRLKNLKYLPI